MTPSERKALVFLALVAVLGVGTRAARSLSADVPADAEARQALARQIAAVDSARRASRAPRSPKSARPRRAHRPPAGAGSAGGTGPGVAAPPEPLVDLDVADSAAIEHLPRVGPALAQRVVADRLRNGAFGSLTGLQRVRGIGPGVARILAPHVTFSGTPRLTGAEPSGTARARRSPRGAASRRVYLAPLPHARPTPGVGVLRVVSP